MAVRSGITACVMVVTVDENLSKVWGKLPAAFGGRFRHERFGYLSDRSPDQILFTNQATAVYDPATGANYGAKPNTGYQDADFFLGAASSYSQRKNAPFGHSHLREYGFYIQDNFRVSRALTINAGLRWEMHPAPAMKNNDYVTFDLKNNAIVLPKDPGAYVANGFTTQAILTNLKNLGAKFETPQQAGLPRRGISTAWRTSCHASDLPTFCPSGTGAP
jgi:hypothetical protein